MSSVEGDSVNDDSVEESASEGSDAVVDGTSVESGGGEGDA